MKQTIEYYLEELKSDAHYLNVSGVLTYTEVLGTTVTSIHDVHLGNLENDIKDVLDSITLELTNLPKPADTGLFWYFVGEDIESGSCNYEAVKGTLSDFLRGYNIMLGYNLSIAKFKEYMPTVCKPNTSIPSNIGVEDFHAVMGIIHVKKKGDTYIVDDGVTSMDNPNHSVQFKVYSLVYNNLCVVNEKDV